MNTYENQSRYGEGINEREGKVARTIEHQTAKLPSDLFLWTAGAAVVGSLALQIFGKSRGIFGAPSRAPLASFVGMWVPSILLLGVYNKIVKVAGSDRIDR